MSNRYLIICPGVISSVVDKYQAEPLIKYLSSLDELKRDYVFVFTDVFGTRLKVTLKVGDVIILKRLPE